MIGNMMKLHLGCGKRYLEGFFHIDIADFPHVDRIHRIDELSMFDSNSVDVIYSSHSLEYFDRFEALDVLSEWLRVLRPDGQLYVAVPNFRSLAELYLSHNDLAVVNGPVVGRWAVEGSSEVVYHRSVWDLPTLTGAMLSSGYSDVAEYNPVEFLGQIDSSYDDHSLAYFPHFDLTGTPISLCLRATK